MPIRKKVNDKSPVAWALLRLSLGFIFLWAFIDKLVGLGFATCRNAKTGVVDVLCEKAWVNGGSPTSGFLKNATKGPLEGFYQGMAGQAWADWLFMLGLLLIGVALIAGIALKLAALGGSLLLLMMWSAVLLPDNNPFMDDHIVYAIVLWGIYLNRENAKWSLNKWWRRQWFVKKLPILE